MSDKKTIKVRPYTTKELAALYGVDIKTLRKWLKPHKERIGERIGYYYNIDQVKVIFQLLSLPFDLTFEEGIEK